MWNYRVVKENGLYGVREVHYLGEDRHGWTEGGNELQNWESYEDLKGTYDLIKGAFEKPVMVVIKGEDGRERLEEEKP
jgi:hypothetical protein